MNLIYATRCEELPVTSDFDEVLQALTPQPAVFAVLPREGMEPYIGRTGDIHRRLMRLLRRRQGVSRLLNLREVAFRVIYWPTASKIESSLVLYECARHYLPQTYSDVLKLRFPSYVQLLTEH